MDKGEANGAGFGPGSATARRLRRAVAILTGRGARALVAEAGGWLRFHLERRLAGLELPGFADRHRLPDTCEVVLYGDDPALLPAHRLRRPRPPAGRPRRAVSLIATCRNEAGNVAAWAERVLAQTRRPDEVVVVDSGSGDGTAARLDEIAARSPIPFRVLHRPGAGIARGRNLAVEAARHDVIASTDFGCRPRPDWLERLVEPFEDGRETAVVAGWFQPVDRGWRPVARPCWPRLDEIDPASFLPSARSLAFTREAWRAVRGFPEWLTATGEDTWFALELRRAAPHWAFVPDAVVEWLAPETAAELFRKVQAWCAGDGESGLNAAMARRSLWLVTGTLAWAGLSLAAIGGGAVLLAASRPTGGALLAAGLLPWAVRVAALVARPALRERQAWVAATVAGQVAGYLCGLARRGAADRRRLAASRATWIVLSGVAIDDGGGGARAARIAHQLLDRGSFVAFVNRWPRNETVNLGIEPRHPDLLTVPWRRFDVEAFLAAQAHARAGRRLAVLVEFPLAEFLPVLAAVRARGGVVVYDLLDDWESTLGASWYDGRTEAAIAAAAAVLIATAPALRNRLEERYRRPVELVPNAVDRTLFDPRRRYERPADLPRAPWIAVYAGALWGDWFDWDLLVAAARRHREAAFVLIGDYRGECPERLPNLHFLGLKPQTALPAYYAHSSLALLPWKVTPVTHATSPLKVYELLAMHRPVVAPDLEALAGLPGVLRAADAATFVELVGRARHHALDTAELDRFAAANDWRERVDRIEAAVERAAARR